MFVYGADFFLFKPGLVLLALGLLLTLPLSFGDRSTIGPFTLSLYWHARSALALPVVGLQSVLPRLRRAGALRLHGRGDGGAGCGSFPYTRTVADRASGLFVARRRARGAAASSTYVGNDFELPARRATDEPPRRARA